MHQNRFPDESERRPKPADSAFLDTLAQLVQEEISEQWPPGFFDEVVGAWKGDRLERESQPPLEFSRIVRLRVEDWESPPG